MSKIFVIDIDDTISKWDDNRDFLKFKPNQETIDKINLLYDKGHRIVLFTARGMRMYQNKVLAEANNRKTLELWLNNNKVKYHELIFGKPFGDYYIDDKNLSISEFIEWES